MHSSRLFSRLPGVYLIIIVINIVLFVLAVTRGVNLMKPSTTDMIAWGANVAALSLTGDAWRLLTSMFLHVGLIHILLNMYMLYVFGPLVEEQFGSKRFTLIYLLSGLFGSLVSAEYHGAQGNIVVAAGASGALMGIAGAYIGHWIVSNARHEPQARLGASGPLAQTIGLNLVLGFINPGVDNACHIGGLIGGIVLGIAFALGDFRQSAQKRVIASTLITLASLGIMYAVLQRPASDTLTEIGAQIRASEQATERAE